MSSALSFALLAALPAAALAENVIGKGFVKQDITPILPSAHSKTFRFRRQNEVGIAQQRGGTLYTVSMSMGTPGQDVSVIIDTGSSELWVNADCAKAGSAANTAWCSGFPKYSPAASSSSDDLNKNSDISYGSGHVDLEYYTDNISVGSAAIDALQFGVASESDGIPLGIMGLGPDLDGTNDYPYVLDAMKSQGLINSRAFTLDLRGIENPVGAVIFGGIDTSKYIGDLEKCPILDLTSTKGDRYWISLNKVATTGTDGSSTSFYNDASGFPVFLDSGGTLSRLPQALYQAIGESFPTAQLDEPSGFYLVDCSVANQDASIDFTFGGKTINVLYKDFIWHVPGSTYCVVGVLPDDDSPVLGDSFLRAAYVVYDQDNRNLHLAQAANCGSNLVAIGSGADAVPSMAGDCKGSSSSTSSSSSSTSTSTSTSSSSSVSTTSYSSFSTSSYYNSSSTGYWPTFNTSVPYPTSTPYPTSSLYPTSTGYSYPSSSEKPTYDSTTSCTSTSTGKATPTGEYTPHYPTSVVKPTYTSTYTTTSTYTVTACPDYVTDCPIGKPTTTVYETTTEYCKSAVPTVTIPHLSEYTAACRNCGAGTGASTTYPVAKPTGGSKGKDHGGHGAGGHGEEASTYPTPSNGGEEYPAPTGSQAAPTTTYPAGGAAGPTGTGSYYPTSTPVVAGAGNVKVGAGLVAVAGVVAALLM